MSGGGCHLMNGIADLLPWFPIKLSYPARLLPARARLCRLACPRTCSLARARKGRKKVKSIKTGIDTNCQPLFLYIPLPYHLPSILHVDAMLGCVLDKSTLEVEERSIDMRYWGDSYPCCLICRIWDVWGLVPVRRNDSRMSGDWYLPSQRWCKDTKNYL